MTNPFIFRNGKKACNIEELVNLCAQYPEDGIFHLMSGHLEPWLSYIGEESISAIAQLSREAEGSPLDKIYGFVSAMKKEMGSLAGKDEGGCEDFIDLAENGKFPDESIIEDPEMGVKDDLDIPIPPPPIIKQLNPEVDPLVFSDPRFAGDPRYNNIFVKCDLCGGNISVPVPKDVVLNSQLPVVPVTYVHGPEENHHAILLHLDHDFQVRRRRFSYLVE
ncbi:MAG TPA: hypothetical protein VKK79_12460 [Candidatus Lokiarchaeia archaeon]|nr:hypothetical protein [Candidatus Lokiarchaeia archaeon]